MPFHETVDSAATDGVSCYGVYRKGIWHLHDGVCNVPHSSPCSPSHAGGEFSLSDYGMLDLTSIKYDWHLFRRHGQKGETIRMGYYQQKNIA